MTDVTKKEEKELKDDLEFECTVLVKAKQMKITIDENEKGEALIIMAKASCCRGAV